MVKPEPEKPKVRRKKSLKLKRGLFRNPEMRPLDEEDIRYAYAAYRKGAFGAAFDDGLAPTDFREALIQMVAGSENVGGFVVTVQDSAPLVLFHVNVLPPRMEFYPVWFPWATPRNRIECSLRFMREMNKEWTVIATTQEQDRGLYYHLRRYGVMRYIGEIKDYFDPGSAYLFQGVRS